MYWFLIRYKLLFPWRLRFMIANRSSLSFFSWQLSWFLTIISHWLLCLLIRKFILLSIIMIWKSRILSFDISKIIFTSPLRLIIMILLSLIILVIISFYFRLFVTWWMVSRWRIYLFYISSKIKILSAQKRSFLKVDEMFLNET